MANLQTPNLDNLPDEIYLFYFFKLLDLDDLWNLRLLTKRFYSLIKSYEINELTFLDYKRSNRQNNWFSTIESTRPENQLDHSSLHLLSNPSNNLLNLKYLRIQDYVSRSIQVEVFEKFIKLEILEIRELRLSSNALLKQQNLHSLSIEIGFGCFKSGSLTMDTPNLYSLDIQSYFDGSSLLDNKIKFNHLNSVKHLQINYYDKNVLIFNNLECLELSSQISSYLKSNDLLKFNHLKKIRFNSDNIDDELNDLFKSKKNDLELSLNGVRIKEINKITELKEGSMLKFQLDNYDELENDLNFVWEMYFDSLISLLPDNQPPDLFTKYTNIQDLIIDSKVKDENRLIQFIKGCSNLNQLKITRSLTQQFYDNLPTIKSLFILLIVGKGDLNFGFVIKFPYLKAFYTRQDVLMNENLNLNNFKRLIRFRFKIGNNRIDLTKDGVDKYSVDNWDSSGLPDQEYFAYNEIIEWFNRLRKKNDKDDKLRFKKMKISM